jgi:hypothetical protein
MAPYEEEPINLKDGVGIVEGVVMFFSNEELRAYLAHSTFFF